MIGWKFNRCDWLSINPKHFKVVIDVYMIIHEVYWAFIFLYITVHKQEDVQYLKVNNTPGIEPNELKFRICG
jgi:hypothetical protein